MNKTNHPSAFIPYPSYKDSGVAWLGDVPKYWEMRKFRTILTPIAERNRPDLPLLSVVREKGVIERNIKDDSENYNYIPDDLSNYKIVKSGQFAMNKMKAWQGSYGISKFHGIVSPAYFVFDLKCIEPGFFHKAVRSRAYVPFFTQASDGVRVGQWDLSQTRMKEIPFGVPSIPEQTQIARFLDYKTAQIARFIKAKKRMIELLKEQKQVIINDAVTGKIVIKDEGGRLKVEKRPDSSFIPHPSSFLQTVPGGWEVRRLKDIFSNMNTKRVPLSGVQRGMMKTHEYNYYGASGIIDKVDDYIFDDDLLLIAEDGANLVLRNLPLAIIARGKFWVNNHAHILKPKIGSIEFYAHLLESVNYLPWISGAAQPKLTQDRLMAIRVSVPSEKEQLFILKWIKNNTQSLDLAISRTEREIALIQEYRTRLVSDVVTGKIDVRDIEIPDIAGIDDTIDESIDEPEGEEELETAEAEE